MNGYKNGFMHSFKGIMVLLAIFLGMMWLMRYTAGVVGKLNFSQGIVDLVFAPSPQYTAAVLTSMEESAAKFYRWVFLTVDFVYVLAYCTFYRCSIRYMLQKDYAPTHIINRLTMRPVIGGIADLTENTLIFIMLGTGAAPTALCVMLMIANIIKFLFVYSSLMIVLGGTIWKIRGLLSS